VSRLLPSKTASRAAFQTRPASAISRVGRSDAALLSLGDAFDPTLGWRPEAFLAYCDRAKASWSGARLRMTHNA
jgi:hypothetical protein